jgi:predicted nucleotidyltransferase
MDKREAVRIATKYVPLARDVVDFERSVLFGSHALGSAQEYSDIDVGLFVSS